MKITLVSTYTHPIALGLRFVSSYLKAAGHDVQVLFMSSKRDTAKADFTQPLLDEFVERCRDSQLIGMSLMTNNFHRACKLTQTLKSAGVKAPIIWGGTHPTVAPDESIEVPDIICVGEGEGPMLQLADALEAGRDPLGIDSLGFKAGGIFRNKTVIRNQVRNLEKDLDDYPFPDYELQTHFIAEVDTLVPARLDNLRGTLHRLRVETTRGCPYPCTFCNNAALIKTYKGKGSWVRKRSADNVIAEIKQAMACFPTIEGVSVVDDLFFVRSEEEIEEFAEKYAKQVNLPIEVDAFPNTISEQKVKSLMRVPIRLISMGIQSGSPKTLKDIYKRPTKIEDITEGIRIFSTHKIPTEYHYIISNPYEPDENVIETMRFVADHHQGPSELRVFPLMFYPGTPLYDRAKADGLIGERDEYAYNYMYTGGLQFAKHDYLGVWLRTVLSLRNVGTPRSVCHKLIDVVTNRHVRRALDRTWFPLTAFLTYQISRKIIRNFIYQPFIRPWKYLKRKPKETWHDRNPQDEVTLPRNNHGLGGVPLPSKQRSWKASECPPPTMAWQVPKVNVHAQRIRAVGSYLVTLNAMPGYNGNDRNGQKAEAASPPQPAAANG